MILKIHKKYLEKAERYGRWGYQSSFNPYAVRYIFVLPEDSKYPGYAYFRDTSDRQYDQNGELIIESVGAGYELKGNYYCFDTIEGETFKLVKYKGREEGKSYKRYNLNAEEMFAAFNYGNIEMEKLNVVCAEVLEYLNNGTRRSGTVISGSFTVGHSDGTWLYLNNEKRRINSKGVRIIGVVAENKEQEIREFIKLYYNELNSDFKKINEIRETKQKLESAEKEWNRLKNRATINSCKKISSDILNFCSNEIEVLEKEIVKIEKNNELKELNFEKIIKDKFLVK